MNNYNNNRILSYNMAEEITEDELKEVSGAGCQGTMRASYSDRSGSDVNADFDCDL